LINANPYALFHRLGVEKAPVRLNQTWFWEAYETSIESRYDFVAIHGVFHPINAGEFVNAGVRGWAFCIETIHFAVKHERRVGADFGLEACDTRGAVADPAIAFRFRPYDAETAFALAPEARAVFQAFGHGGSGKRILSIWYVVS
jgi:hypothetical protein